MNKNDYKGILAYFLIALVFGGPVSFICGIVHEDNDRCHYYNGEWNKKDLAIVTASSIAGGLVNIVLTILLLTLIF